MSSPAYRLYRISDGAVLEQGSVRHVLQGIDWNTLINRDDLYAHLARLASSTAVLSGAAAPTDLLSPVGSQEVWAAGVTYLRSRDARMAESKKMGGDTFYDRVYAADRPEIFFKATPHRVAPPGGPMRLRRDSTWDVPEPEFTLFITSSGRVVAYTVGNDLSSRSIEGENPLYLPQAKTWDSSASLGPCLYIPSEPLPPDTTIELRIRRAGQDAFCGEARLEQMKRTFPELAGWLCRESSFPSGVFLMTGTCIVPPDGFTLRAGDEMRITVPAIGTLVNFIKG